MGAPMYYVLSHLEPEFKYSIQRKLTVAVTEQKKLMLRENNILESVR
jgi:hypothetical protein